MAQAGYTTLMTSERTEIQTLPVLKTLCRAWRNFDKETEVQHGGMGRAEGNPQQWYTWGDGAEQGQQLYSMILRVPSSSAYSVLLWSLLLQFPDYQLSLSCMAATIGMESNSSPRQCGAWNSIQRLQEPFLWAPPACCCWWEGRQLHGFVTQHLGVPKGQNREDQARPLLYLFYHGILSVTRRDGNRKTAQEILH